MAQGKPCDTWSFEALCAESSTLEPIYVSALAMTSIDGCVDFEIESSACPGMRTGIPKPTTMAPIAEQKEFLAYVYQQEAEQLHCAYGHCGADILIQSLSHHHGNKLRHLYPYIRRANQAR